MRTKNVRNRYETKGGIAFVKNPIILLWLNDTILMVTCWLICYIAEDISDCKYIDHFSTSHVKLTQQDNNTEMCLAVRSQLINNKNDFNGWKAERRTILKVGTSILLEVD